MNKIRTVLFFVSLVSVINVNASDYDAVLMWPDKQVLGYSVQGIVNKLDVQAGDKVKKGQKLARLGLTPFNIQLKQAQAKLDRIEPLLFDAQRDFDQGQELFERTVLSEVELQKLESILKGLQADHDEATAGLEMARWRHSRAQLIAPFDGRITEVLMRKGDIVTVETRASRVIVMVSNRLMQAGFLVDAASAGEYVTGKNAYVEVASERYPAIVKSVTADSHQQYRIRLEFEVPADHSLVEGQKAKVIF